MSIVYHKQPCPKCKAKCQIWIQNGKEFRWCHYCGWKERTKIAKLEGKK